MNESLIRPEGSTKQIPMKISLHESILMRMKKYMEWAGFSSDNNFIEKCVIHVLENDKNFRKFMKEKL